MVAPDESTDPGKAVVASRTDPDFEVRPAIEGTDPLARGGWHSSGGTKATVVAMPVPQPGEAPSTVLEAAPAPPRQARIISSEIEVARVPGIPLARVIVLLLVASAVAFVLGRWTS